MNSEITPSEHSIHFALKDGEREVSQVDLKIAKAAAAALVPCKISEETTVYLDPEELKAKFKNLSTLDFSKIDPELLKGLILIGAKEITP